MTFDYLAEAAKMVVKKRHDLVIEVANPVNGDWFYHSLRHKHYRGKYIALNNDHSAPIKPDATRKRKRRILPSLEDSLKPKYKILYGLSNALYGDILSGKIGCGMFRGNAVSDKDISDVIEIVKPETPVYVANRAIGAILGDPETIEKWAGKNACDGGEFSVAEVWAENLSNTPIKRALLSDYVLSQDSPRIKIEMEESGRNYFTDVGMVSENLYSALLGNFEGRGWKIRDIEFDVHSHDYDGKNVFRIAELSR